MEPEFKLLARWTKLQLLFQKFCDRMKADPRFELEMRRLWHSFPDKAKATVVIMKTKYQQALRPAEAAEISMWIQAYFSRKPTRRPITAKEKSDMWSRQHGICPCCNRMMYIQPTLRERRIIFKVANEKQDKVSPNLLMWIRSQLGLLSGAEKEFQPLIQLLNTENCSPLRGRIITGAERIRYGIMAQQLIKIFSKSKLSSLSLKGKTLDNETRLTLICTYLKGWQKATGCDFSTQQREFGPLTKISGIRYILFLLPAFYDTIIQKRLKFDECDLASMIVNLYRQFGTTPKDFFDPNSSFNADNPDSLLAFRSEGATTTLAETHAAMIKNMDSDDYDPFH